MAESVYRIPRVSWGLLVAVAVVVALSALWVALTPVGDQTTLTGRSWEQFTAQDPEVASLFALDLRILGFLGAGLGLLAAVVAAIPYRRGERWAWYALWLFAVAVGIVAALMLVDEYPAAAYYAGLTAVAVVGLALPMRSFLRPVQPGTGG